MRTLLLSTQQSRAVISEAERVIDFIGVGVGLIGVSNLCSVAFGLAIRNASPKLWNEFCFDVDKPDWITDILKQTSRFSRSLGSPDHGKPIGLSPLRRDDAQETSDDQLPSVEDEEYLEDHIRQRHAGLATAFDDKEFNEKAEKLLNGSHNEDVEAARTVITGDDSVPTRCSRFNTMIQERYLGARYRRKK